MVETIPQDLTVDLVVDTETKATVKTDFHQVARGELNITLVADPV